jgi:hypothetical protein
LKLVYTVKASHHTFLKRSQVKTLTRLFKVRPYKLLIIKRSKKSIRIQGLLTHGINNDSYNKLGPDFKYENKEIIT